MRNIWTIAVREYKHYFTSAIAYAFAFGILLILGVLFYITLLQSTMSQQAPGIDAVVGPLVTLLLFTTPALTMRSLAEEQKMGTLELLLTSPVRDYEVVVGKWLAGWGFLITVLLITWAYPLILNQIISPGIDQGSMVAAYLGLFLMTAVFVAIGVAVSSFFSNQIAAFFLSIGIILILWIIGYGASASSNSGAFSEILRFLDMSDHFYGSFYRGIVELKSVIYYISMTIFALVIGSVSIEARRWR